ncbi:hypothetical protein [Pseudotabrizicola sp. 4114]|uniref:hypothetical protein n=1 Tax=Pseudotabrizicola sp. 4114 TaxID=2817731 RepID=UPI0028614921|nr:hypothetical protein [Pseudorhodobacter sp. 4114]
MARFFQDTLTHGLNSSVDALCGRQFRRRLATLHRDAAAPTGAQIPLFATGTGRKRLFH